MSSIPKNEGELGFSLGAVNAAIAVESFRKGNASGETARCGPAPVSSLPVGEVCDLMASCKVLS